MHGYSFWIGLLVPFGIIYIINWVIFIIIIASLLCRPNIKKETSYNEKFSKVKKNFMIALGLSLLFGFGWAFGLLASDDVLVEVRYPAEWIFTLMTAFLGVYLFAFYILRSTEARRFWKSCLPCQHKKATVMPNATAKRPESRKRSTVSSWRKALQATLRIPDRDTSEQNSSSTLERITASTSATPYSFTTSAGEMASKYAEPSCVLESTKGRSTSPYLAEGEIELVHKVDEDMQSINEVNIKAVSPSQVPVNSQDGETNSGSIAETGFQDNTSLNGFHGFPPSTDPSQSAGNREGSTLQGTQVEQHI